MNLDQGFFLAHVQQYQLLLCSSESLAAVFRVNGTQPLDNLVPAGWTLDTVFGINDPGQIAGTASFNGTRYDVLLTPVPTPSPEPGTFGMLAAGLMLALAPRASRAFWHR